MRIGAFLMLLAVTSCATPGSGTMHPSTPARSSGAATISLVRVGMVSRLVGWGLAGPSAGGAALAIGTTVVRTADGGRHWATVLRADGVVTADFHDSARAWVLLVIGSESTASRESVVVASTADAGASWQRTARLGVDGVATRMQFVDTSHGWVFAQPSAGGAVGAQDTTLYRTVDGGQRWQAVKPASPGRQNPDIRGPRSPGDYRGSEWAERFSDVQKPRPWSIMERRPPSSRPARRRLHRFGARLDDRTRPGRRIRASLALCHG